MTRKTFSLTGALGALLMTAGLAVHAEAADTVPAPQASASRAKPAQAPRQDAQRPAMGQGHEMSRPGDRHMHGGMSMQGRMLDAIKATPDQRGQLVKIRYEEREAARQLMADGKGLHEQMRALLSAPVIDEKAVEQLRQKMSAHHDQMSKLHVQTLVRSAQVLTAEQRAQLAKLHQQRVIFIHQCT